MTTFDPKPYDGPISCAELCILIDDDDELLSALRSPQSVLREKYGASLRPGEDGASEGVSILHNTIRRGK